MFITDYPLGIVSKSPNMFQCCGYSQCDMLKIPEMKPEDYREEVRNVRDTGAALPGEVDATKLTV